MDQAQLDRWAGTDIPAITPAATGHDSTAETVQDLKEVGKGVVECGWEATHAGANYTPVLATGYHGYHAIDELNESYKAEKAGDTAAQEAHGKAAAVQAVEMIPFIGSPVALGSALTRLATGEGYDRGSDFMPKTPRGAAEIDPNNDWNPR